VQSNLASELAKIVADEFPTGAVFGLTRPSGVAEIFSFGVADTANGREPMTSDHRFLLTSLTKPITCLHVLLVAEQGLLEIDLPISHLFPSFRQDGKETITVRHLLAHTSGLQNEPNSVEAIFPSWSQTDHLRRAMEAPVVFSPGSRAEYCSASFWVLAELVSQVTGTPHAVHLAKSLLKPMRMHHTAYETDSIPPNLVLPSNRNTSAFAVAEYVRQAGYPAGGLVSSVHDLLLLGRCLLGNGACDGRQIVSPATVETLFAAASAGTYDGRAVRWTLGGWELGGPRSLGPENSLYKSGVSGSAMWVDRSIGVSCVLLTSAWPRPADSAHGRIVDVVVTELGPQSSTLPSVVASE
jgi:CubicO group peptidase (beta-lactamase class C family)